MGELLSVDNDRELYGLFDTWLVQGSFSVRTSRDDTQAYHALAE